MNTFLRMAPQERRLAFQQVDAEMGLQAASVEKDFWVCWTLRELFRLPGLGSHLTFKGGTSLSKGWKLIHRFSEDIDIIVDKEILGFAGDAAPEAAPSNKKRKGRLDVLKAASRDWVQGRVLPELAGTIRAVLGPAGWRLEVDPDMEDGQCLLFHYPSVFAEGAAGYVRPVVKIEMGARSDDWPGEDRILQPYVTEFFPALDAEATFAVRVLAVERTFWEKACLLHEETFRPLEKPRKARMARHYYDLWALLQAGIGDRALGQMDLFLRVAAHREVFFRQSWVDYSTHRPGSFRLVPLDSQRSEWLADYRQMQGPMFFATVPDFQEILHVVGEFEHRFNRLGPLSAPV